MESRVRNGNNFDILEMLANTTNFIGSGRHVHWVTFLGFSQVLHVLSVNNMIGGKIIARSNNTYNYGHEFIFVGRILLIFQNIWNNGNRVVQIFDFNFDIFLSTFVIFKRADYFFAFIFKMKLG